MQMRLRVRWSKQHQEIMMRQALAAYPEECCGFLFGEALATEGHAGGWWLNEVRPATNVSKAPRAGYELDGREQLAAIKHAEANGLEVFGYYHSHPNGRRGPSPTDFVLAGGEVKFLALAEVAKLPAELHQAAGGRLPDHSIHFIIAVQDEVVIEISAWQLRPDLSGFDQVELESFDFI